MCLPLLLSYLQSRTLHRPDKYTVERLTREYQKIKSEALALSGELQAPDNIMVQRRNLLLTGVPSMVQKLFCIVKLYNTCSSNQFIRVFSNGYDSDSSIAYAEYLALLDLLSTLSDPHAPAISPDSPLFNELTEAHNKILDLKDMLANAR